MKQKIGFTAENNNPPAPEVTCGAPLSPAAPKKSLVQVYFPTRNMDLAYYNDAFDLHAGDLVYVDGKLDGLLGRVTQVSYSFKIKLADYKRVIAVADTRVTGEFHLAGSHMVTFDPAAIPYEKVLTWFKAPAKEEDEFVSGQDGTGFPLEDLAAMNVPPKIAERGHDYYLQNRVAYLCLNGTRGRAIVEGSVPYELEFELQEDEVRDLTCGCYCSYPCKHSFAAMLQLRETLEFIRFHYAEQLAGSDYFAVLSKKAFFTFAVDTKKAGSFILK